MIHTTAHREYHSSRTPWDLAVWDLTAWDLTAWDLTVWDRERTDVFNGAELTLYGRYVFNGLVAEEPILSSAYICAFSDLEIRAVLLDQLLREPETPSQEYAVTFEVQALREARELLESSSPSALADAQEYIEKNTHPRLWRLLAEAALAKLDFVTADKAFVHCVDYNGVQFVKRSPDGRSNAGRWRTAAAAATTPAAVAHAHRCARPVLGPLAQLPAARRREEASGGGRCLLW